MTAVLYVCVSIRAIGRSSDRTRDSANRRIGATKIQYKDDRSHPGDEYQQRTKIDESCIPNRSSHTRVSNVSETGVHIYARTQRKLTAITHIPLFRYQRERNRLPAGE